MQGRRGFERVLQIAAVIACLVGAGRAQAQDPDCTGGSQVTCPSEAAPVVGEPRGVVLPPGPPRTAQARVALVIGESAYGAPFGSLRNPKNDADLIAQVLRGAGFDVELAEDLDQKAMKRAILRLGHRLAAAGPSVTGLFYYAGHGFQSRGVNYLVPIGAQITREEDADIEAVAADQVLSQMTGEVNIVIMDACRDTPVVRAARSEVRGLAEIEDTTKGSFIAFSTAPGQVAVDGSGDNSPFAEALAAEMATPQPIEDLFRNVRRRVIEATGGAQTPWDSSSLVEPFFFIGEAPAPIAASENTDFVEGGRAAFNAKDYAQAMSLWRKAADEGKAEAEDGVAALYWEGLGAPRDPAQAMSWWRKAADRGDATAMCEIGSRLWSGDGVQQDQAEARQWNERAAAAGSLTCQKWLTAHPE